MPSTPLRFLQISDVHVDSKLTHGQLGWPKDKREARVREINSLVHRAMELVPHYGIEAVLIPGDLWDSESVSQESVHGLVEAFASIDPIPVFVAPGNHDFCSSWSYYSRAAQAACGMRQWSENVIIFDKPNFSACYHPMRDDVVVVGRAFLENVKTTERLLSQRISSPVADIRLLLFHGSLDGYVREGKRKITAPFSREELLTQGFSYTALGHYHNFDQILDGDGKVRGAYAGSTGGRTITEAGPRYVLVGSVDSTGLVGELEKIEIDPRRVCALDVDLTGVDGPEIVSRIEAAISVRECRPADIVAVTLSGRVPKGFSASPLEQNFQERFFHFKLFDRTVPDYEIDDYDRRMVQGRFAEQMKLGMASAESSETRQLFERALYYGLDALIQGEVKPKYED
ncbi:MAG TPA: metallophosphoesterase [Pyrinomonadaceae bacterium]|nr:metallophosphoesterase [Pyrinomonadaceae bacterium]